VPLWVKSVDDVSREWSICSHTLSSRHLRAANQFTIPWITARIREYVAKWCGIVPRVAFCHATLEYLEDLAAELLKLPVECFTIKAEDARSIGLVALNSIEDAEDIVLFEFFEGE
jgi:hypothetical protein